MTFRFGIVMLLATVATVLVAACGSSQPADTSMQTPVPPTQTPVASSPTATPTTPTPVPTLASTPTPAATETSDWLVNDVEVIQPECVDFYPGVFNPDGPNHWYNVAGSWANFSDTAITVLAKFQILDTNSDVLLELEMEPRLLGPDEIVPFNQGHPVEPAAGQVSCRVAFTVEGDAAGAEKFAPAEFQQVYAP